MLPCWLKKPFSALSNSFKSSPLNSLPRSMSYVTVDLPLFPDQLLQLPFLYLLMFSVTLQTTLRNFSHINLVFPMPWGMESVSSKVFIQILVAFDYSKINTWGAKRSLRGKGIDSSPFFFFQEKRTGV